MTKITEIILAEAVPLMTLAGLLTTAHVVHYLLTRACRATGRRIGRAIETQLRRLIRRLRKRP